MAVSDLSTVGPAKSGATAVHYHLERDFLTLHEDRPGAAWTQVIRRCWPGWRAWFDARGGSSESDAAGSRAMRRYMPELEAMLDTLSARLPDDPHFRNFLRFWCPPLYLVSCSQAASVDDEGPYLIRNYDLDPKLNDAILLRSAWRGKVVLGMVEGLIGLSDGINENGLAVSLSFGGRVQSGRGFGIPLIIRYLLEVCADTKDALEALRLVPSHMSYNVTMTDRSGAALTAFVAPDRPLMVSKHPWATNHQIGVEWPGHGRMSATSERFDILAGHFSGGNPPARALGKQFRTAPFFAKNYRAGYGTVFTTLYRPRSGTATIGWKTGDQHQAQLDRADNRTIRVTYTNKGSVAHMKGPIP